MSKGVLLIARNNSEVDYVKQAVFSAKRIKKYLNLPVSIVTDNVQYLNERYTDSISVFDKVIELEKESSYTYKKYYDGSWTRKNLEFKNTSRSSVFDLTPYNETLLLDTDFIIANNLLSNCFTQAHDFLIYQDAFDLAGWRDVSEFNSISEVGPNFYWATAVFFRKTETNKVFFNLIKHIQENWLHYRNLYQIRTSVFRNDHAFSIAIHMMNGFQAGDFAKPMPGTMYYSIDRDLLVEINNEDFLILLEKENEAGKYFPTKIKNSNVHVMNKFSLGRVIDNDN
jgi:hypothetical protein